jgi:hypothetical protein
MRGKIFSAAHTLSFSRKTCVRFCWRCGQSRRGCANDIWSRRGGAVVVERGLRTEEGYDGGRINEWNLAVGDILAVLLMICGLGWGKN